MSGTIEARLAALGIELPGAASPVANYVPWVISGDMLFISGQLAKAADGSMITGTLGADCSLEDGQKAARLCALGILAQAKAALGTLDRIARVIRLTGFVNSAQGFADQPKVVNGASDLFVEVLGEKGRHARAAVGVSGLPANSAVEVDAIIEIELV